VRCSTDRAARIAHAVIYSDRRAGETRLEAARRAADAIDCEPAHALLLADQLHVGEVLANDANRRGQPRSGARPDPATIRERAGMLLRLAQHGVRITSKDARPVATFEQAAEAENRRRRTVGLPEVRPDDLRRPIGETGPANR
jgi:hypothetical protein